MKYRHKYVTTLNVVLKYGHGHYDNMAFYVSTDQFLDSDPIQIDWWKKNYLYFMINKVDLYFKNFRLNEMIYELEPEEKFKKRKITLQKDVFNETTRTWTKESYYPTLNQYLESFKKKSLLNNDGIELKTRNVDWDSKRQYIMCYKQDNVLGHYVYNLDPQKVDGISQYSLRKSSKHKYSFYPRCKKRVDLKSYNSSNHLSTLLDSMDCSNKYGIVSFGPLMNGEEPPKDSTGIILERNFQVTVYTYLYMTLSGLMPNLNF